MTIDTYSSSDMLLALLQDMNRVTGRTPDEIELSELDGKDKLFMMIASAVDVVANAIVAAAKDRADAVHGSESLSNDIRRKIERIYDGHQRSH